MTGNSRDFHLGDILSITTGRLVSPRDMDGVWELLDYMTGAGLLLHQLPRARGECEGPLLAQHPGLAQVTVPDDFGGREGVQAWLAEQAARFGETLSVSPLAEADHTHIDPVTETRMAAPQARLIVVRRADGDEDGSD